MVKSTLIPKDNNIIKIPIEEAMPDNYIPYAVEVAKDRALPDVRDGLKPVHRRIIYGAYILKAFPDRPYYKSARIVGDILGRYHPHGDTSVYDAMVILAQNFTTRMPIIDGHGNWGSQDGDSAAAMRYTEARLTPIAMEMIEGIEKDVVNMVDNYSGSEKEPEVLPARYPNLLVNGAFGIAVGLATNIPPHNLKEVIEAACAYIDQPEISTEELMEYIKGPDLPTGGIIIGRKSLISAYTTGEGRATLRAKTSIEKLENGKLGIVITEFPYRRSKAKLLQTISEMTADKKHMKVLEPISDIRDESDRKGIRAVIEFKKSTDIDLAEKVLKYLLKKTDLQCNIFFNMVALANGKPVTMGLKLILKHYIDYQKEIITRRTKTELDAAGRRFHIVEGFIRALAVMDEIIQTIRSSKSKKDAASNLMEKFQFTNEQAEAILELMLYRLTGLEIISFEKEHKELLKIIKRLTKILDSEREILNIIKKELLEIKEKHGDERRTLVIEEEEEAKIDVEELIIDEDIVITMSNEGFIKRISLKSFNRSTREIKDIEYREGDFNKYFINSSTKDIVVFFTDKGNMYKVKGIDIPEFKWREKGEKLGNIIKGINLSEENIVAIYSIDDFNSALDVVFFTTLGGMKRSKIDAFVTKYTKLMALKLKKEEELVDIKLVDRNKEINFVKINTEIGLEFTVKVPELNLEDRNTVTTELFPLTYEDKVIKVDFSEKPQYKKFHININKSGIIKASNSGRAFKNTLTSSSSTVLIFTVEGKVFSMPAFMIQEIENRGISIKKLMGDISASDILKIISIENFNCGHIYFFTKYGMIKKTELKDFKDVIQWSIAYKFKDNKDYLINVEYSEKEKNEILLITETGMGIKFQGDFVNSMGKLAAGVTGINLKSEDNIVYSMIIEEKKDYKLNLTSIKGNKKQIKLKDIVLQNRGGRGTSIMLVVMEDRITEVKPVSSDS
ncbi:DNA topoisomerase IV subunit A [Clostridium sp. WILCCON 0269]|uniref:DNA topoisomerase (ATP-hydrolyzing) n=1 Tax=Candidatus Clostridium eludens TaxID=3381663 RepID=A0ABW8SPG4_9CLOT